MAVYNNLTKDSVISAVEFTPVSDGNFAFFHVADPAKKDDVKTWLTSPGMNQEIIAETTVNNQPVFVTRGDKTKDDIMKAMEERGDKLQLKVAKKPFNYWALRGGLSVVGQSLHLASAIYGVEKLKKDDPRITPGNKYFVPHLKEAFDHNGEKGAWVRRKFQADIGIFAILNQTANVANIVYGGQQEKGDNRLHAVKGLINDQLGDHLAVGDTPIGITENRSELRKGPKHEQGTVAKFNEFFKENSVHFFEVGLRIIGSSALVIPWRKEKLSKAWGELSKGNLHASWNAAKNTDKNYFWAGVSYLTGKVMALVAKVPDPYSDKPHTALDTFREKYLFRLSTLVEMSGASGMAYNAYSNKKIGRADSKSPNRIDMQPHRDWLSTVGGSSFVAGFVARFFAPLGEKHVDMEEVYAHAADTLAKTPPEKIPQLMADTSASLKEHFKDKPVEFGDIFTKMMTDMYRYHHIALNSTDKPLASPTEAADKANMGSFSKADKIESKRPQDRINMPAASHAADIAARNAAAESSLSRLT